MTAKTVNSKVEGVTKKSQLRILTNKKWIAQYEISGCPVVAEPLRNNHRSFLGRCGPLALWRYDAVFIDGDIPWLLTLCTVRKLLPWVRCPIMVADIILNRPRGLADHLKVFVWRWLLREVDLFVLYFRDTSELQQVFSIPSGKIRYVPFKPNTLERILEMSVSDEGFFLSAGRSNRDIKTLFQAFRDLPYSCTILAPWDGLEQHGTRVDGSECPPNVSLVSDDGTTASWNSWIARSRAVVLPIKPGNLSPSGIGTYLVAMALGKCVIITEGPATRQILNDEVAVLVPPSDARALRAAIIRVAEDSAFRNGIARQGKEYALSLGGESRLRADLIRELSMLIGDR